MPPLSYEKLPPSADDVKLAPRTVSLINENSDSGFKDVVFYIAQEDTFTFVNDIVRNSKGNVSLTEVQRGLTIAAEAITNTHKSTYLRGVAAIIAENLKRN